MLIELKNVYKIYSEGLESEVRALDGVSLTIDRGEFVAVVGQSGSGKSTMMNVLGCLDIPTHGTYLLDGVDVKELTDRELSPTSATGRSALSSSSTTSSRASTCWKMWSCL
jgi:putative ABC transport system ATP-binding protein